MVDDDLFLDDDCLNLSEQDPLPTDLAEVQMTDVIPDSSTTAIALEENLPKNPPPDTKKIRRSNRPKKPSGR